MKTMSHWSPRYIRNRMAEMMYQRRHPTLPWLTRTANEILAGYLKPEDVFLEFGSGRSTMWFSTKVKHIISVEDNKAWYDKVSDMFKAAGKKNITYHYAPRDKPDTDAGDSEYVGVLKQIADESVDVILDDGIYRDFCAQKALRKLRPGGVLIIDNVNWYLPSDSISPCSRSFADGPKGPVWKEVWSVISQWRMIWTSSGVTDTAFFFKPGAKS